MLSLKRPPTSLELRENSNSNGVWLIRYYSHQSYQSRLSERFFESSTFRVNRLNMFKVIMKNGSVTPFWCLSPEHWTYPAYNCSFFVYMEHVLTCLASSRKLLFSRAFQQFLLASKIFVSLKSLNLKLSHKCKNGHIQECFIWSLGIIHLVRTQYFPKNEHIWPPDTHIYVCVSVGKKC